MTKVGITGIPCEKTLSSMLLMALCRCLLLAIVIGDNERDLDLTFVNGFTGRMRRPNERMKSMCSLASGSEIRSLECRLTFHAEHDQEKYV